MLEQYANKHGLHWIDDESNQNDAFSRNYLRNQIMPLLVTKWPNAVKNITSCATNCQQAKLNLDALARLDCDELNLITHPLSFNTIKHLPRPRIANIVRVWLKKNAVNLPSMQTFNRILDEMIFARHDASPCVQWGHVKIKRYQQRLFILGQHTIAYQNQMKLQQSESPRATLEQHGVITQDTDTIDVRFRQGGELFFLNGQTKSLKKLFQQWGIPPWLRDSVPLIYVNDKLVLVVGYAVSEH